MDRLTYRSYLTLQTMSRTGVSWTLAREAVATTAMEHPEWDMDRKATREEFEAEEAAR